MKWWQRCAVVSLVVLFPAWTTSAQDEEPLPVTPGAGKYLPPVEALGDGWSTVWQAGIDPGAELFQEGVWSVYGGPAGARAIVYAWVTQDSATAIRRSWESAKEQMDRQQYEFAPDRDYSRIDEIDNLAPPPGCAESSRAEGVASESAYPAGLTMCAVDPDVILLAIVSGSLEGATGYVAADALIALALEAGAR